MTQLSSFDPTQQFGESTSSGVAAVAGWLFSKVRQPDVMVVLAMCAVGLIVTLVAASTLPGFSIALLQADMVVGP
jgi:hypothetical protein